MKGGESEGKNNEGERNGKEKKMKQHCRRKDGEKELGIRCGRGGRRRGNRKQAEEER